MLIDEKLVIDRLERELQLEKLYKNTFDLWMYLKQKNKSITKYLYNKGYSRVFVYGMNELGARLVTEIDDSPVELVGVIDKCPYLMGDYDLYSPDDELPEADLIVVTALYYYGEICNELKGKTSIPIISLLQLFDEAFGFCFS